MHSRCLEIKLKIKRGGFYCTYNYGEKLVFHNYRASVLVILSDNKVKFNWNNLGETRSVIIASVKTRAAVNIKISQ